MGKYLIVNADGYGFTHGINRGIEEAVARGIVTSISVNANFPPVADLQHFARVYPQISVGVHLNPVVGRPLASPRDVPTLVTADGEFHYQDFAHRLQRGRIDLDELAFELSLQIERVRDMGIQISHLDSHQNQHLYPRYFRVFLGLLTRHGIACMRTHAHFVPADSPRLWLDRGLFYLRQPSRLPTHLWTRYEMALARRHGAIMADRLMSTSNTGHKAVLSRWLQLLRNVPEGWNEVFCHPAYPDDALRRWATYVEPRRAEVEVMTSRETRETVEQCGIALRSFHDLFHARAAVPEILTQANLGYQPPSGRSRG